MRFFHVGDRRYAQFERLALEAGLSHAFSTRPHDVSARLDERAGERAARRAAMAADLGLDPARLFYCEQVHATQLAVIDARAAAGRYEGFDALVTDQPGTALMTFSADCPLVLLFDPHRRALGMAHASWRCTTALIAQQLVAAMQTHFCCRPDDLLAGIGPSAGPEQYEVGEDVYAAAAGLPQREKLFPRRNGRMYFDLWQANRLLLIESGVRPDHIELAGLCTMTRTDLFYSYRREGPGCGHFGLMAAMHPAHCGESEESHQGECGLSVRT